MCKTKVFIKILVISADIKSVKEIFNLSGADLQRLMKLSSADIQCLLKTVSYTLRRNSMLTGNIVKLKIMLYLYLKILSLGEKKFQLPINTVM